MLNATWLPYACRTWLRCQHLFVNTPGLVGGVIALAVMLAVLLLANAVCCYTFKRRKQAPPPPPPARARDPNVDAELGRLQ